MHRIARLGRGLLAACAALALLCAGASMTGCAATGADTEPAASQAAETVAVTQQVGEAEPQTVAVAEGASVLDVLDASGASYQTEDSSFGAYVTSIEGKKAQGSSGWTYAVNGEEPDVGAADYTVQAGDVVVWSYVTYE